MACLLQGLEAVVEREQLLLPLPLPQPWQATEETLGAVGQSSSRTHPYKQSMEAARPVVSSCAGVPIDYCAQVHCSQTVRAHGEGCRLQSLAWSTAPRCLAARPLGLMVRAVACSCLHSPLYPGAWQPDRQGSW